MDSYTSLIAHENRKERDNKLTNYALETLRNEGNVLIPCETSGRVLELLLILDQSWKQEKYEYKIYFYSHVSASVVEVAQRNAEWASDSIMNSFQHTSDNAFKLQ